jgi:hypothetical protein
MQRHRGRAGTHRNGLSLTWIKLPAGAIVDLCAMTSRPPVTPSPRPSRTVRPCPVCGIAMQASKSREDLADFDTFQCLSCHTTIQATPRTPPGRVR